MVFYYHLNQWLIKFRKFLNANQHSNARLPVRAQEVPPRGGVRARSSRRSCAPCPLCPRGDGDLSLPVSGVQQQVIGALPCSLSRPALVSLAIKQQRIPLFLSVTIALFFY